MGDMLRARKLLSSVISGKAEEVRKVLQTNPELVRNACIDCKGLMYKCINEWTEKKLVLCFHSKIVLNSGKFIIKK